MPGRKARLDEMKQVTVIIPNYNGAAYLQNCLESLLQNDPGLFDILVIDNASTDGSERVTEQIKEQRKEQAQLLRQIRLPENTGFTGAVNTGIRQARTPFVLLLNNDTRVAAGFVEAMLRAAQESDRIFAVSAKMLSMQEPKKIDDAGDTYCALGWAYGRGKGKSSERYQKACRVFAACGGAALYRRELLLQLGCFDEQHFAYLEDIDISYRAKIYGYYNVYTPHAIVYHAGSAVSGSKHNAFKVSLSSRNSIYLIYKNMPMLQILWNSPFLLLGFLVKAAFFTSKGLGAVYIKGLVKGLCLSASLEGKSHKIRFAWSNLFHYFTIQLELWGGLFGLLR